jgi:hydroxylamine reductase (hybrid-cluster protein)
MYKIDTFEQLIVFIENTNLTQQQIETLVNKTINVIVLTEIGKDYSKTELIRDLKEFWGTYGNKSTTERPIFLMDSLDIKATN